MRELEHIYTNGFFKNRDEQFGWRAPLLAAAICDELAPFSVVDVGAAIGDVVKAFSDKGVTAIGIEGSKKAEKYLVCARESMLFMDLRKPLKLNRMFDLCTCFEVAEHIEEEFADIFIESLVSLSKRIVVSICNEGGGRHHVNLKPMSYWDDKFALCGYRRDDSISERIKARLEEHSEKPWLKMILERLHYYEGKP